jgi:hypothetical protein
MTQEIAIHRAVHQQHIVEFYSFFEDDQNVYIILELCRRRVSYLFELNYRFIFFSRGYIRAGN